MAKKQHDLTDEMKALLAEIENDPTLSSSNKISEEEALILQSEVMKDKHIDSIQRTEATEIKVVRAHAGKYITFTLAGEDYGLYILSVKEIIGMMSITRVPRTPDFVRGVINLRGKVHPVIDLRKRFGLEQRDDDARTPIIIVEISHKAGSQFLGIVVDSVSEVVTLDDSMIEDTPAFGVDLDTDFILGIAKINQKVITLLDIDKILTSRQLVMIQN
jgi:purine-binding chemotaxis protein CheW